MIRFVSFISFRYLFTRKSKNLANFLSIFAFLGVTIGSMALIIVLSTFNGLDDLVRQLFTTFDPDIKITSKEGKSFEINSQMIEQIKIIEGVELISEVIEDNALLKYRDKQTVVKFKGVTSNYFQQNSFGNSIIYGTSNLRNDSVFKTLIGMGVKYKLGLTNEPDNMYPLVFWYPKNSEKIQLNPQKSFTQLPIGYGGAFSIERQFDEIYVYVDIEFAKKLTQLTSNRTALEISIHPNVNTNNVKEKIQKTVGNQFLVQDSNEQHQDLYRAHKIEKLFSVVIFIFILLIISLNIFYSLSILILDKKRDIAVLNSFGVHKNEVFKIFLFNGMSISFIGTLAGIILGTVFCYLQTTFGLISMNLESSLLEYYPVKMKILDILLTLSILLIISFIVSYIPSKKAMDFCNNSNLQ